MSALSVARSRMLWLVGLASVVLVTRPAAQQAPKPQANDSPLLAKTLNTPRMPEV